MSTPSEVSHPIIRRGWLQLLALAVMVFLECPASAQSRESGDTSDAAVRGTQRSLAGMLQTPGALDFIDLSAGPWQRPRGALRFRFESATRALRGFGVEADECRTLLRSTSSRANQSQAGGSDGVRLGLAVTLNCSFF